MTRSHYFCALALLSILHFAAFCSGAEFFSDAPAESRAEKATGTPEASPRPLESEPQRQVIQMELTGRDDTEPKLGYGTCQWLNPLEAAPEKKLQEPEYQSDNPIYYAATFGDAEDNVFAFAIDESGGTGKGYDLVYVDGNNDNRLDAEKERFEFTLSTRGNSVPLRIRLQVTAGGVTAPYYLNFAAFPYSDDKYLLEKIHANLRNGSYYQGEAVLLGRRRKIAIADLDSSGLFNDVEQGLFKGDRFFVDLKGNDASERRSERMDSFPYGRYTRIEGVWYSIVASPDGSRVEISRAQPALGKIEVPSRITDLTLSSPTQPLHLKFVDGSDDAVVGTYRVHWVRLLAEGEHFTGRALQGSFLGRGTELTVVEGQSTRLEAGLPLKVEPQILVDEERTLGIRLQITGAGGESYRWSPRRGDSSSRAGFEILDSSGEQIASGKFEYG
jgi:hypothetical protein